MTEKIKALIKYIIHLRKIEKYIVDLSDHLSPADVQDGILFNEEIKNRKHFYLQPR